jgi:hypothetical protein
MTPELCAPSGVQIVRSALGHDGVGEPDQANGQRHEPDRGQGRSLERRDNRHLAWSTRRSRSRTR